MINKFMSNKAPVLKLDIPSEDPLNTNQAELNLISKNIDYPL